MKPVQHLLLQGLLIATVLLPTAIANAASKQEMHRIGAKADDGSGWHVAVSTKGSFSALLPIPFNDFTISDEAKGETIHVVGGKSSEGIKFSVVEIASAAKPPPDLASIPKAMAATPGNRVTDVSRSTKDEADILTLTTANATTTLYMRAVQLRGVRYVLTIEFPNSYRELVAANKDKFFDSFKVKAKS
jgi:hypothetical protein